MYMKRKSPWAPHNRLPPSLLITQCWLDCFKLKGFHVALTVFFGVSVLITVWDFSGLTFWLALFPQMVFHSVHAGMWWFVIRAVLIGSFITRTRRSLRAQLFPPTLIHPVWLKYPVYVHLKILFRCIKIPLARTMLCNIPLKSFKYKDTLCLFPCWLTHKHTNTETN